MLALAALMLYRDTNYSCNPLSFSKFYILV